MQKQNEIITSEIDQFKLGHKPQASDNREKKEPLGDLLLDIQDQYNGGNLNIDEAVKKFKRLYDDKPKFQKSRIYRCIVNIQNKPNVSLEAIAEICESIYYKVELDSSKEGAEGEFVKWLDRMVDNINLEIARQNYLVSIEGKLQEIGNSLENKNKQIEKLEDDVKETTRNHIVILGIFASIILTAISGLVFTTSVLSNIDKSSIYRLIFMTCLIALFIFNTLSCLFRFISSFNANYENNIKKKPSYIQRFTYFNIIIFVIIVFDGLAWCIIEKRQVLFEFITRLFMYFCNQ